MVRLYDLQDLDGNLNCKFQLVKLLIWSVVIVFGRNRACRCCQWALFILSFFLKILSILSIFCKPQKNPMQTLMFHFFIAMMSILLSDREGFPILHLCCFLIDYLPSYTIHHQQLGLGRSRRLLDKKLAT